MEKKKNSSFPMPSDISRERSRSEDGWILAFVLFLLIAIQGLALASLSLAKHQIKSSSAFFHITSGIFSGRIVAGPVINRFSLPAPEGWDQACFSTDLHEAVQGKEKLYTWRIGDRGCPGACPDEVLLASSRPYIVLVVDDSGSMNLSSGRNYTDDSLYLKRPGGETVLISEASEIPASAAAPEGTYFRGSYGNQHMQATADGVHTEAMPMWAQSFSRAGSLTDTLELCETAVLSTSRGMVQGFTHDHGILSRALDDLHPGAHDAKLAETLYQAISLFPEDCPTARSIILVTSGRAVNDGNLPVWLRDFDGDADPGDRAAEEGCRCADDVAAYALSKGIRVHVIGPDTEFNRKIAGRGGGTFMPDRDSFMSDLSFACHGPVIYGNTELVPVNRLALFDPPWLRTAGYAAFRPGVLDPSELVSCPGLAIRGLATGLSLSGSILYCTTSRDDLLSISLPSGDLKWLVSGIGGAIAVRGNRIISGPNSSGQVFCLDGRPAVYWLDRGDCFDASPTSAYIARGSSITARRLDSGISFATADTAHDITCLRYDVGSAALLAGTKNGVVVCYDQELRFKGIMTGTAEAVRDIRTFVWRKKPFILVIDRKTVSCRTFEAVLWSAPLDEGRPVSCLAADRKVFVNAWKEGSPCGGIDTGVSKMIVLDAISGELIREKILCSGKAFGPALDIPGKRLVYTSWDGTGHGEDISDLYGIAWTSAGRRIIRPGL